MQMLPHRKVGESTFAIVMFGSVMVLPVDAPNIFTLGERDRGEGKQGWSEGIGRSLYTDQYSQTFNNKAYL